MMKFETKAIHCGNQADPVTGAIMPPIYMTSTYLQEAPGESKSGYDYTRANNPNFVILENTLASLEIAEYATVFSSGLGALTAMLSFLSQGDCVAYIDGVYGGTYRLFNSIFSRFGIDFISISQPTKENLEKVLRKVKCLFFETPTNPLLEIFDIEGIATLAKKHGVMTIVDNTFATPYFQNPLSLGADIVWHSSTKYIGGHSDIVGGAAMTNNPQIKKELDFARKAMGLNPSPFDTWLLTRSVKTLALRMEKHQFNAFAVANFLNQHPLVEKVYYPGLDNHKNHDLAKKQMTGYAGVISVEFKLSLENTKKLISSFNLFSLAESLGGVESLVSHPATMTHASIPLLERHRVGITDGLIRFSIGIENDVDLINDLKKTLKLFV